ncbi:TolC family protein [Kordiimonas sp.]|uniref:TolC family protein n=1 Tax=Kordiimonas sp. TaxID=1970157 RepID=UPI003A92FB3F
MKKLAFAVTILAVAGAAGAGDTFLPNAAIATAVIGAHPSVSAAEARLSVAAAEARGRRAGNHDFLVSSSYTRRDIRGEGTHGEWDGSISRAIRLPGKASADRKIGALGIEVAENARDDARHQVALLLKDYWFEWLGASTRTEIEQLAVEAYRRELEMAERRHSLQESALIDVEGARSALAAAEAAMLKSNALRLEAERVLRTIFPDLTVPLRAPDVPAPTVTEYSAQEWRDLILARSHELRMAEKEAEQQLALARRVRLDKVGDPALGIRVFSERGGEEQGVGLTFSVPFGPARRNADSDAQRARALAAEAEARHVRRVIEEVADRDITRAETGLNVWQQTVVAMTASEQVVARVRRAVELGERDMVELTRALAQHYDIRREEAAARIAAQDALTQLRIDSHEIWVATHHDHQD